MLVTIVNALSGFVLDIDGGSQKAFLGSILISIFAIIIFYMILLKAQRAVNVAEDDPQGKSNASYTGANFLWMFIGAAFWLVTIVSYVIIFSALSAT